MGTCVSGSTKESHAPLACFLVFLLTAALYFCLITTAATVASRGPTCLPHMACFHFFGVLVDGMQCWRFLFENRLRRFLRENQLRSIECKPSQILLVRIDTRRWSLRISLLLFQKSGRCPHPQQLLPHQCSSVQDRDTYSLPSHHRAVGVNVVHASTDGSVVEIACAPYEYCLRHG